MDTIRTALNNPLVVVLISLAIGGIFARYMHDFVNRRDKTLRPLLIISVINASIIAIIWRAEVQFQTVGWFTAAVTWLPQEIFLAPTLILLVIAIIYHNRHSVWVNALATGFVVAVLMGIHIAPSVAATGEATIRAMTFNVSHWSQGSTAVANVVMEARPTVFCLEESGVHAGVSGNPLRDLERALPGYHFLHRGELTIGSKYALEACADIPLPPGQPALMATVYGVPRRFSVIAVDMLPCETSSAVHDPAGYFNTYIHARADQVQALLKSVKSNHGPTLICGSFNGSPLAVGYRELTTRYHDAFQEMGNGFGFTSPARFPMVRSDAILLSDGLAARAAWVSNGTGGGHLPTVADIAFDHTTSS